MSERAAGFTLIEVLIAVVLISVVMLAVCPMFIYASRTNASVADLGSCGALAVERMEILRTQEFGSLAVGGDLDADVAEFSDLSHAGFVVRWSISDAGTPADSKRVAVRALALRTTVGLEKQSNLVTLRLR